MAFRAKLGAQIISSLLAIYLGFFAIEPALAVQVIKHSAYWLLLIATLLTVHAGYRVYQETPFTLNLNFIRRQRMPLIVIIGLSLIFYLLQDDGYKVVLDEAVLAATALNMHHEKEAMTLTRAYNVGGTFNVLGGFVGKRPYFFPFVVSALHDLTGYRAYQGVVLNHLLTPVFLGLLYIMGHRLGGRLGGYFALALCATVPLLAINVNGGGFELLNIVMLLATLWAGMMYLRKQTDARLNLMILLAVLLAQTRYESASYVLCVGAIVLLSWFREKRIRLTRVSIVVPLLLVCIPLQQIVFGQHPELWQIKNDAAAPFTLAMIPQNLEHALNFFFTLFPIQPGSPLLSGLFCAALVCVPYLVLTRRTKSFLSSIDAPALLCFFALIVFNFFLLMAYHWGQVDDIVASRIVIPFIIFQILLVVAVIRFMPFARRTYLFGIVAAIIFFVAVTRPENARTDYLVRLVEQRDVAWVVEKVREFKGKDILFITDKHLAVLAEQESCLPQILAAKAKPQIDLHLKLGTFSEAIVFYRMVKPVKGEGNWKVETPIEKDFDIEVMEERKLSETLYGRMGRIRGVNFRENDPLPYDASMLSSLSDSEVNMSIFAKTLP